MKEIGICNTSSCSLGSELEGGLPALSALSEVERKTCKLTNSSSKGRCLEGKVQGAMAQRSPLILGKTGIPSQRGCHKE